LKLALRWRYLIISGANFSRTKSTDSEGVAHFCIDLFRPNKFRIIDVELQHNLDFELLAKIQELTTTDPLIVWTKLEVYSKKTNIPVVLVFKDFLVGKLKYEDICRIQSKSFRLGKYLYSVVE
jgi:hypothetical protein